ncbi:MAG: YfhO family protein [Vulcanimicrobiota bacterium]
MKNELRGAALFSLVLILMIAAAFYPASAGKALIYSGDFTGSDGLDLNVPLKANLGRALSAGHFPLWTPHILCGYPLLNEGQTGMFYPFNTIFSLLGPLWCFNGLVMLHFFIAGLGMYCYSRNRELTFGSSALTGVVFAFCSFHVLHARQLNLLEAVSWAPWLFLFGERHIRNRRPADLLLWSLILSLQWLCGHPAITYLVLLGLVSLYGLAWIRDIMEKNRRYLYFFPLSFLGGIFLSGGIAALQIIPTLELIPLSLRSALSLQGATRFPFMPLDLIYLFAPFFQGNPGRATYLPESIHTAGVFWENCVYLGIAPVILAILSLLWLQKDRRVRLYSLVAAVSVIIATGTLTPLYSILWHVVPGFHLFRFPSRFLFFALFALTVLSGITWDHFSQALKSSKIRWTATSLLIAVSFLNVFWFNRNFNGTVPPSWLDSPRTMQYIPQSSVPPCRIYTYAPFYSWQRAWRNDRGWLEESRDHRYLDEYRNLLAPDYSLLFDVSQVGEKTYIEGGMAPRERARLEETLENNACARQTGNVVILGDKLVRTLQMENVEIILSFFILAHPMIERITPGTDIGGVNVYRLRGSMPRAYCVFKRHMVSGSDEALQYLLSENFRASEEVILEEEPPVTLPNREGSSKTDIVSYGDNEVRLRVTCDEPAILFMSDTCFPGWKVYVDGQERKIMRANYAFRAVAVDRGNHEVAFIYFPGSLKIGIAISFLSLSLWAVLLCSYRRTGSVAENQG